MATPVTPRKPKLVVEVVLGLIPGGIPTIVMMLARHLDPRLFRLHIVCLQRKGELLRPLRDMGVEVTYCNTRPMWSPRRVWRLRNTIRRISPDLVHIHNSPLTLPACTACRLAGNIPYVVQYHNDLTQHFRRIGSIGRWYERKLTLNARSVIAVSQSTAKSGCSALGIPHEKVRVVLNGVDLDEYQAATPGNLHEELGIAPDRPIVALLARLAEFKAPMDFIRAARLLLDSWPTEGKPRPAFVMIGKGDLWRECERMISATGLQKDVFLAGARTDVPSVLKACSVGALSSNGKEGSPLVLYEYAAANLPIVTTDLPMIRETFRDGRHALFSPAGDTAALAANLRTVLLDSKLAGDLTVAAREEILPDHSWARIIRNYQGIYEAALGMPCSSPATAASEPDLG